MKSLRDLQRRADERNVDREVLLLRVEDASRRARKALCPTEALRLHRLLARAVMESVAAGDPGNVTQTARAFRAGRRP